MWVQFPLAWYIDLSTLFKVRKVYTGNSPRLDYPTRYVLKFGTIYLPGSIKDIRLYLRSSVSYNGYLRSVPKSKILIKQSYLILMWFHYINFSVSRLSTARSNNIIAGGEPLTKQSLKLPSFFIYPTRVSKTTVQKAPMAHKTFSQEQFMVRFYLMSFSYSAYSQFGEVSSSCNNTLGTGNRGTIPTDGVGNSLYVSIFISSMAPNISTNLLFIQRYSVFFYSTDSRFFSLFRFNC